MAVRGCAMPVVPTKRAAKNGRMVATPPRIPSDERLRKGAREERAYTLHERETPGLCPGWNHSMRTVECDGDRDVVECSVCGAQRSAKCNFDEEYS